MSINMIPVLIGAGYTPMRAYLPDGVRLDIDHERRVVRLNASLAGSFGSIEEEKIEVALMLAQALGEIMGEPSPEEWAKEYLGIKKQSPEPKPETRRCTRSFSFGRHQAFKGERNGQKTIRRRRERA